MKHPLRTLLTLGVLTLVIAQLALPQEPDEADEENRATKTIAETTENSDRFEGLFTIYRDRDSGAPHMEISPEQLDREYIYVAVSTDGVVQGGHFRGRYRDNRILSLARHFDRIEIRAKNTAFYFDPESPLSRASEANISSGCSFQSPSLPKTGKTGKVLINVDEVFSAEALLQVKPTPDPDEDRGNRFRLGSLSDDKSKITEIRNYP
ncbi:MAG: hypothetical protein CM1200mP36_00320 [Gammaproteobacteria bacterium]|nr:MAG: hypothetical protein CM1200mP36_00320 [Gammaproteobacteria bacterium]